MEVNRNAEMNSQLYAQLIFDKQESIPNGGKTVSSTNSVRKTLQQHEKE